MKFVARWKLEQYEYHPRGKNYLLEERKSQSKGWKPKESKLTYNYLVSSLIFFRSDENSASQIFFLYFPQIYRLNRD